MKITVATTCPCRANRPRIRALAAWLMQNVPGAWTDISIVLTDDDGITGINRQFLGHDRPTDVISFNYAPAPGENGATAEIFVNAQRAEQCSSKRWPASRELALYVAHGIDHLSGADDRTAAQRARMRRRELRWLGKAARNGLSLRLLA